MFKMWKCRKNNFLAQRAAVALALTISLVLAGEVFSSDEDSAVRAHDKSLPHNVAANSDKNMASSTPQKREVWMDASDYSIANPGVAFVVYGRTPDATNSQIAEFIKKRFIEKGVDSKYFTGRKEDIGVSLGFYLNGDAYGPVGLTKMTTTIEEVAGHARGLKSLQTSPTR